MSRRSPPIVEPRDVARILFRHRGKMLLTFLLLVSAAVGALILLPRTYVSQARLLVRVGRESVALDPTATTGATNPIHKSLESELQTVKDLLLSRAIHEQVLSDLGAEYILAGPDVACGGQAAEQSDFSVGAVKEKLRGVGIAAGVLDASPIYDKAMKKLEKSFDVSAERSSSVIVITCKANSPKRAHDLVEAFIKAAHSQHVRVNHAHGAHAFFADQMTVLRNEWETESAKLRDLKNGQHLVSIEGQRKNLEAEMQLVEASRLTTVTQLAAAKAMVAKLTEEIAALPTRHVSQEVSGFANAASDGLRQDLAKLKIEEARLLARFTPEHREVQDLQERIAKAEKTVASEPELRTQTTEAMHTGRQSLDLQLAQEKAKLSSLEAQLQAVGTEQTQLIARIEGLNEGERKLDGMQRNVDVLAANLRRYSENVEQARIDEALQTDRLSNLNEVHPATFVATPVFPKPTMILAAALVMAVGAAVSLAFVCEYLDRSLKTPHDVATALQAPVLLTTPYSSRSLTKIH